MKRLVLALVGAVVLACALFGSSVLDSIAHAQEAPPANLPPAEERAQQFQRVEGPQTEAIAAGPLLVGAYGAIWVLLFGYLFVVARRQANTRADLVALEKLIAMHARQADAAHASGAKSIPAPPVEPATEPEKAAVREPSAASHDEPSEAP